MHTSSRVSGALLAARRPPPRRRTVCVCLAAAARRRRVCVCVLPPPFNPTSAAGLLRGACHGATHVRPWVRQQGKKWGTPEPRSAAAAAARARC